MKRIRTVEELRSTLAPLRREGRSIGFVPTMGYFHEGHLSLMRRAVADSDRTVVSIYVNPLQFGPDEDLASYPRDLEGDRRQAADAGVDILFTPTDDAIYPDGPERHRTVVAVQELENDLCGASRPGHFRGVTTVVAKLFNCVGPDRAYFGEKDYQQAIIVRRMVRDLNMPVRIITCPTVREEDGLAASSRNTYLDRDERQAATVLYRALQKGREAVTAGERAPQRLETLLAEYIENEPLASVDYTAVRDAGDLSPLERLEGEVVMLLAVQVGPARLIDNMVVDVGSG